MVMNIAWFRDADMLTSGAIIYGHGDLNGQMPSPLPENSIASIVDFEAVEPEGARKP